MPETEPRHWYAIKVFFNKVFEMEALLSTLPDTETFLPADEVQLKGAAHSQARRRIAVAESEGRTDNRYILQGPVIFQRVPMVTSLLFIRTPESRLPEVEKRLVTKDLLGKRGFLYKSADRQSYAVIPDAQMASFRLVVSQGSQGLDFFSAQDITRFRQGNRVRVKEGPLKGAEGYIKRIRKDRRLLVGIDGVVAVATAFIPPELLEIVGE